jgi:hypothetical protein
VAVEVCASEGCLWLAPGFILGFTNEGKRRAKRVHAARLFCPDDWLLATVLKCKVDVYRFAGDAEFVHAVVVGVGHKGAGAIGRHDNASRDV